MSCGFLFLLFIAVIVQLSSIQQIFMLYQKIYSCKRTKKTIIMGIIYIKNKSQNIGGELINWRNIYTVFIYAQIYF